MSARFTVLASGSSGNATLLEAGGFGLLLDCGLSARQIGHRLALRGLTWRNIHAVVLTHTHGDHWCCSALKALVTHAVPLYCHPDHCAALELCEPFTSLRDAGLVHSFAADEWLDMSRHLRVMPHAVSHDADPTFAFRCEGKSGLFGADWSIGYAADLGTWDDELVDTLADNDILAIEFNHDEHMQRSSGRSRDLIERVLGPRGHLSNRQAAKLVAAILERSSRPPAAGIVTLHRSQQCNTQQLVEAAAREVLSGVCVPLHVASQLEPLPTLELRPRRSAIRNLPRPRRQAVAMPGLFED